jgi:hypothetical protein
MNVPTQPMVPQKKGLGPVGWIAIGCGAILVLCLIAFGVIGYFVKKKAEHFATNPGMTMAELAIKANPDLELVSADEDHSTLTIKDKKTGEVTTINADDFKDGKVKITTKDGTATIDGSAAKDGQGGSIKVTDDKGQVSTMTMGANAPKNLPDWVPMYPGGTVQGAYDADNAEERGAMFTVTTQDPVDKVMEFYEARLKAAGLTTQKATYEADGKKGGNVSGNSEDQKRTVSLVISNDGKATTVVTTFAQKH